MEDEAINLISEYNRIAKQTFDTDTWVPGTTLKGCGKLLGYLHYPLDVVNPVARDIHVDQIETTDTSLRIRLEPNLNGKIISHVQLGYYNVLSITEALEEDKEAVEGLECWYEIAPNRYCANITTTFLPKEDDELKRLREENAQLKLLLRQINELSSI